MTNSYDFNEERATARCMVCNNELIWGGDDDVGSDEFSMKSNYSCKNCGLYLEAFMPIK